MHETIHNVYHIDYKLNSITRNISHMTAREKLEDYIFASEIIIDDDTFFNYLKFYRYTDTQIASVLKIPVKYVRIKYQNFDKPKLL